MSFHHSAEDIEIQENHMLVAKLADADGEMQDASIDLNQFIGNDNGMLTLLAPCLPKHGLALILSL